MEPAFQRGDILFLNNWVSALQRPSPPARPRSGTADGGRRLCAGVAGVAVHGGRHCGVQAGRSRHPDRAPGAQGARKVRPAAAIPTRGAVAVAAWHAGTLLNLLCCPGRDDGDVDLLTKGDNNK